MTITENVAFIRDNITFCRPGALEKIISIIEEEYEHYDDKECFMLHEEVDDYFYVTFYKDGSHHIDVIGSRSYEKFVNDDDCIRIERKTKNLFPTVEILLTK